MECVCVCMCDACTQIEKQQQKNGIKQDLTEASANTHMQSKQINADSKILS